MARTPLLQALQELARDFTEADARNIPIEEVQEQRRKRISRRDLLKGTGVIAAGIALSNPLSWGERLFKASASGTPRIGIIGAGISGLNVALTLQDVGLRSTVYEASSSIGGRIHSNTTSWANGQVSEWCGELIDTGHTLMQSLAKRFNLQFVDVHQAEPPGSETTYYFFGNYYTQTQANQDFKPVFKVLQSQLKAAPQTFYNNYTPTGYQLDHISVYNWIEQYVPGGHASNMGQLLDVAYNSEFGRETTAQSSLNLLYLLAYQPKQDYFSILGISDERYRIIGGNQQLPLAIASSLPAGSVKLNSRMTTIKKNNDNTITVTFSTPASTYQETFDHVILTLPFSVLRNLDYSKAGFNRLKQTAIVQIGYGTNSKLQLQFDTRYWNRKGPWPGISTATLSYPTGDPNVLGSYSCYLVGQYTTFTGYEKVRQGNIHFAGEHCSYNYQGYMEGGAREGKRAANEILRDYHLIM